MLTQGRFVAVLLALLGVSVPGITTSLNAQCPDGYSLAWEDADNYYCEPVASQADVLEVPLAVALEDSEMLGKSWRFRKAIIDEMGCLVHNYAVYEYGAKPLPSTKCEVVDLTDCSGAVRWANGRAACFVDHVQASANGPLPGLNTNANGQAAYFRAHGAWIPADGTPRPGDLMFFRVGDNIDHVSVYLGKKHDGTVVMVHAEGAQGRVVFTAIKPSGFYATRLQGYGNVSLLYSKLRN